MPYDRETTHCLTMKAGSVFSWLWVDEERNCFHIVWIVSKDLFVGCLIVAWMRRGWLYVASAV